MHKIYWDATAQPIGASVADVIYHLRADDADDLLMDAVSVDDFELDAPEVYDALDVEYAQGEAVEVDTRVGVRRGRFVGCYRR